MKNLDRLIEILCEERGEKVPVLSEAQKPDFFRALCNVRPPVPASAEFLSLQNEYLTGRKIERGVVNADELEYKNDIALYKGDITSLNTDAIVNAANPAMLGCFHPLHNCIDNAIHSAAGVQLRLECNDVMKGREASVGDVIVTGAYNLPCRYVFHTAGPIVGGRVTEKNKTDLKKCYVECLKKADERALKNIAFCCISTGIYGYPPEQAAIVAVGAVKEYKATTKSGIKIIFDLFTEKDYDIYNAVMR